MSRKWGNNKQIAKKRAKQQRYNLRMTERHPDLPTTQDKTSLVGEVRLNVERVPGVRPAWLRGCGRIPVS